MNVVSVAPRRSRLSSHSLPLLRSHPIHFLSPALKTRRRCSRRKRSPAGPGPCRRFRRSTASAATASRCSSPSRCSSIGVEAVREQRKGEIAAGAAEVVDLKAFDLFEEVGGVGQQRRHDDEGAQSWRNARLQVEPRQDDRAEGPCDAAIDQGRGDLGRREEGNQGEERQPSDADTGEGPQAPAPLSPP